MGINETMKKRREYVWNEWNRIRLSSVKAMSNKERSRIFHKLHQEAKKKYPLN